MYFMNITQSKSRYSFIYSLARPPHRTRRKLDPLNSSIIIFLIREKKNSHFVMIKNQLRLSNGDAIESL